MIGVPLVCRGLIRVIGVPLVCRATLDLLVRSAFYAVTKAVVETAWLAMEPVCVLLRDLTPRSGVHGAVTAIITLTVVLHFPNPQRYQYHPIRTFLQLYECHLDKWG